MNKLGLAAVATLALVGCGDKAREANNAVGAIAQAASAATSMANAQQEAQQFSKDRQEKGDTVAIPYADLQKLLPTAPDGYTATGEAGGSSQSMGAFSMSQATQTYSAGTDGNAPTIEVTIADFGGTQAGYGVLAGPMMMTYSAEDAHSRVKTIKMDLPYTWGTESFNKDDKSSKVTAITRYRYMITVEARNQTADNSAAVRSIVEGVAKKFEGK